MTWTLAFDPSSQTGWALFHHARLMEYGVISGDASHGDYWLRLSHIYSMIDQLYSRLSPDVVALEGVMRGKYNPLGLEYTCAVYSYIGSYATRNGIPLVVVPAISMKAYCAPGWKKHKNNKKAVVLAVNDKYGKAFKIKDNNITDAIGIGWFAIDKRINLNNTLV